MDALAGARMASLQQKLGWSFSADVGPLTGPGRQGNSVASIDKWDGIIGVKGRLGLSTRGNWFLPYYLDVGAGESDLTWQGADGIGYAFTWGEVLPTWRYLDYEFKSHSNVKSLNFNGPLIGVAFHWSAIQSRMIRLEEFPLLVSRLPSACCGCRSGLRRPSSGDGAFGSRADRENLSFVLAASLTLVDLIIGFSFPLAMSRCDPRKDVFIAFVLIADIDSIHGGVIRVLPQMLS